MTFRAMTFRAITVRAGTASRRRRTSALLAAAGLAGLAPAAGRAEDIALGVLTVENQSAWEPVEGYLAETSAVGTKTEIGRAHV